METPFQTVLLSAVFMQSLNIEAHFVITLKYIEKQRTSMPTLQQWRLKVVHLNPSMRTCATCVDMCASGTYC